MVLPVSRSSEPEEYPNRPASFLELWRRKLIGTLNYYDATIHPRFPSPIALMLGFSVLNIVLYWIAMLSVFPELVFGPTFLHYFKTQFPVGILAAVFDTLSFTISLRLVRSATSHPSRTAFVKHLVLSLVNSISVAVLAGMWMVFVFSTSSVLVHRFDQWAGWEDSVSTGTTRTILERKTQMYKDMLKNAVVEPRANWRNISFCSIMSLNDFLPSVIQSILGIMALLEFSLLHYRRMQ